MISERDKKIVAAVFASRGEPEGSFQPGFVVSECIKDTSATKKGDIKFTVFQPDRNSFKYICTIEEYNQCIKEMARPEWMNDGVHSNYYFHKLECKNKGIYTSNKELLKENCNYSFYDKPWFIRSIKM